MDGTDFACVQPHIYSPVEQDVVKGNSRFAEDLAQMTNNIYNIMIMGGMVS